MAITLLPSTSTPGAGEAKSVGVYKNFTFYLLASGTITTGATLAIEAQADDTTWVTIDERDITEPGATLVRAEGPFGAIRANLKSRTDGTYAVTFDAAA